MTAIKMNALRGAEEDLVKGFALIRAVYDVIYTAVSPGFGGEPILAALAEGTKHLRAVHGRLCDAIGDEGLAWKEAKVTTVPHRLDEVLRQFDIAEVSVRAAVVSPFLMAADDVRQNAAVEQMRSAAMILENVIELVETPRT